MEGEIVLSGYKLLEAVHINLQNVSIVVPQDDFRTMPVVFEFIEKYFDKKRFSQQYQLNAFEINSREARDDEFDVLYVPPRVDALEVFKLGKKNLLGRVIEQNYQNISATERDSCFGQLNSLILSPMSQLLSNYNLALACNTNDFWSLSKIMELVSNDRELYSSFDERSQYELKFMLIDLFAQLNSDKKKLLLLDLPEQGLAKSEFLQLLACVDKNKESISNTIIYTQSSNIINVYRNILSYHVVKENQIWGMDDYDEIESLLDFGEILDNKEKEFQFLKSLFNQTIFESDYKEISESFFSR